MFPLVDGLAHQIFLGPGPWIFTTQAQLIINIHFMLGDLIDPDHGTF